MRLITTWATWLERRGWGYAAHERLIQDLRRALTQQELDWDGKLPLPVPGPCEWDATTGRLICYGIRTMDHIPRLDISAIQPLWRMWWRLVRAWGIPSAVVHRQDFQRLRDPFHSPSRSRVDETTHPE